MEQETDDTFEGTARRISDEHFINEASPLGSKHTVWGGGRMRPIPIPMDVQLYSSSAGCRPFLTDSQVNQIASEIAPFPSGKLLLDPSLYFDETLFNPHLAVATLAGKFNVTDTVLKQIVQDAVAKFRKSLVVKLVEWTPESKAYNMSAEDIENIVDTQANGKKASTCTVWRSDLAPQTKDRDTIAEYAKEMVHHETQMLEHILRAPAPKRHRQMSFTLVELAKMLVTKGTHSLEKDED